MPLEVRDLVKTYRLPRPWREKIKAPLQRQTRLALNGLSLSVFPGERLALIGPNGAGKTTLARISAGTMLPDAGTARVAGFDVAHGTAWHAAVGFARPDDPALHPRLSPLECLRFHAALYGKRLGSAQVLAALEPLDNKKVATQRVQTLSAGEKAKVSLAKALLHQPALLILDEISRVLDPGTALRARQILIEYTKQGGAVLLITHDLAEAALCDRVAVMQAGKVRAQGAWAQVEPHAREVFGL